jgi:two-component system, NtrC family, sensor histidine kinase GlrK
VNVRTKLSGAFALYIALLAGLSYYHVRTIQRAVTSSRALAEIATRLRVTSMVQVSRLTAMNEDAEKFVVTRDSGYLAKVRQALTEFDTELKRLDSLQLSLKERALLAPLAERWDSSMQLANALGPKPDSVAVTRFRTSLDPVLAETQTLGVATQDAMTQELGKSEKSQRDAEQLTIVAAGGAVLLTLILSALLARSILEPLTRLTEGTRQVSAGRFDHRIAARGSDELAQVAREFNTMTARLDELDRMKREFVSKVSHDLKTPLSSMQETSSVLLDEVPGPLTPKQRQLLEITQDSAQRLSVMLNKLLDLSRFEAGAQAVHRIVDVRPLVQRSIERLTEASSTNRVVYAAPDPGFRLLVSADPEGLTQVVDNLLENALKFSPVDRQIRVRVADFTSRGDIPPERWAAVRQNGAVPGAVLVSVTDEGPGVADDEKERVFARFYQSEAGRAVRGRGVGLGLSICQAIVAEHGGAIWVADNEPRGSVFNVLIPAAGRVESGEAGSPALVSNSATST